MRIDTRREWYTRADKGTSSMVQIHPDRITLPITPPPRGDLPHQKTSSAAGVHWVVIVASVEERLFTAYKLYGQVTLEWDEIASLLRDDAVATRITAKAAEEAGVEHPGADMVGGHRRGETWQQFVARVHKCCSR